VIVSIEVAELAPGVTDDGESAQVGIGPVAIDGSWTAVTAQES